MPVQFTALRAWFRFGPTLSALVVFGGTLCGWRAFTDNVIATLHGFRFFQISPSLEQEISKLRGFGTGPILVLTTDTAGLSPHIWRMLLYPRKSVVIDPSGVDPSEWRDKGIWFAVSSGENPLDPGFRTRTCVQPDPGRRKICYGELEE